MRKSLIGYYPPTEAELKELWKSGLIVLDANVLLNLYRYSDSAREELLLLLDKLKDRLWIPYQVALEYHRNRLGLIREEHKSCKDFLKEFDHLVQSLEQTRRHPFVSASVQNKLKGLVEELRSEIATDSEKLDALRRKDPLLEQITSVYEGRVGAKPDAAKKERWSKEGEERYRCGVPPGFEDHKKADERKFGDLYLWMEILDHVRVNKLPVIFVTDDAKKDWWREAGGETIGPNPALISEIVAITSKPFHMYRPEKFVEYASKQFSQPVSAEVVEEVKEAQTAAQEAAKARLLSNSTGLSGKAWQAAFNQLSHSDDLRMRHERDRELLRLHEIEQNYLRNLERQDHFRREQEVEDEFRRQMELEEHYRRDMELQDQLRREYEMEANFRRLHELERQLEAQRNIDELRTQEEKARLSMRHRNDGKSPTSS